MNNYIQQLVNESNSPKPPYVISDYGINKTYVRAPTKLTNSLKAITGDEDIKVFVDIGTNASSTRIVLGLGDYTIMTVRFLMNKKVYEVNFGSTVYNESFKIYPGTGAPPYLRRAWTKNGDKYSALYKNSDFKTGSHLMYLTSADLKQIQKVLNDNNFIRDIMGFVGLGDKYNRKITRD